MKKMTRPSTKLRANGNFIDIIEHCPFVLRLSKHERIFSHTLSLTDERGVKGMMKSHKDFEDSGTIKSLYR